jgi:lipoyl(octanoyl) transferase
LSPPPVIGKNPARSEGNAVGGSRQQVIDLDRDLVAGDHDRALRHREIVDEDMDRVVLRGVEFDDGAAAEPEHLVDWHLGRPQHHRNIDTYIIQCRHFAPYLTPDALTIWSQGSPRIAPAPSRCLPYGNRPTPDAMAPQLSPRYGYKVVNTRDELTFGLFPAAGSAPVEWRVSDAPVDYDIALEFMTARAEAIARGEAAELVWLLEHPALYTAGTSAQPSELIEARFPVHMTGRGGQFTYHGPGQRVGYVMLDLKRRAPDVRRFVASIEEWLIRTLASFNVRGERRDDRIGVWVPRPNKGDKFEDKIAAIGIRVRHWVTLHGFSLNVEPELSHFSGIVPCGVADRRYGVTSLADLGLPVSMPEVDVALRAAFEPLFGATQAVLKTENNSSPRRSFTSAGLASR